VAARSEVQVHYGIRSIALPDEAIRRESLNRPTNTVVVTAYAARTGFGDTDATIKARLDGKSSAVVFQGPTGGTEPRVAAPLSIDSAHLYDPFAELNLNSKDQRWFSYQAGVELVVVRDALNRAGLLGPDGRLDHSVDPERGGLFVYSGSGQQLNYYSIGKKVDEGRRVKPTDPFQAFTDQPNIRVAEQLGLTGGKARFASAACASSPYAFEDAYLQITSGELDFVVAGGIETVFENPDHSEKIFAFFDALHSLSRNPDPETANRPLDRNREGFVLGEGAAVLVLESLEHAQQRGAKILAVLEQATTSIDADDQTMANQDNVSRLMRRTLTDRRAGRLILPAVYMGHLTSTKVGDPIEIGALRGAIPEEYIGETAIVAPKSATSHTVGASGAMAAVELVNTLETGSIAPTIHLQEPDEELIHGLDIVTERRDSSPTNAPQNGAVVSMGFGGQNGGIRLRKWEE